MRTSNLDHFAPQSAIRALHSRQKARLEWNAPMLRPVNNRDSLGSVVPGRHGPYDSDSNHESTQNHILFARVEKVDLENLEKGDLVGLNRKMGKH